MSDALGTERNQRYIDRAQTEPKRHWLVAAAELAVIAARAPDAMRSLVARAASHA